MRRRLHGQHPLRTGRLIEKPRSFGLNSTKSTKISLASRLQMAYCRAMATSDRHRQTTHMPICYCFFRAAPPSAQRRSPRPAKVTGALIASSLRTRALFFAAALRLTRSASHARNGDATGIFPRRKEQYGTPTPCCTRQCGSHSRKIVRAAMARKPHVPASGKLRLSRDWQ